MAKNLPATARRLASLLTTALVLVLIAGLMPIGTISAGQNVNAQSGDYPDSLTVESQTFIFDRTVPLSDQQLSEVGQESENQILAGTDGGPLDAVYVSTPNRAEEELGRYLPSGPEVSGDCRAQAADIPTATANGETYAFAGFEEDVNPVDLQSIAETEIAGEAATLYAAPDESGVSEFFAETSQGLYRFIQLDSGVPINLPDEIPFGDQTLTGAASSDIDVSTLTQVGCIGPYPAFAQDDSAPFSQVAIQVGGTAVAFDVSEAAAPEETPEVVPTEDDTNGPDASPVEETSAPVGETPETSPTTEATEEPVESAALPGPERPEDFPLVISVTDQDSLFSRIVLTDVSGLDIVEERDDLVIYGGDDDALFATLADSPAGQAGRYLPIAVGADTTCPVDALNVSQPFVIDDIPYAFAGIEATLATGDLQFLENYSVQVGNQTVDAYAAPDAETPLSEIFLDTDSGLLRFVSLAEDGVPGQLEDTIPFGEQTLSGAQSVEIDPASLTKVGCLGEFPAYAPQGESDAPFTAVYAVLSGTVIEFQVEGGETTPTEAPTETPTETPVPATETPVPTETAIPTETPIPATEPPVPTETPVPATETPVPEATSVPETETEVPPTEPAATETTVPVTEPAAATETNVPATETQPSPAETAAPTSEAPTQVPPTAVSTRVLAPAAVVPTRAAEAPPAAAATAEPHACTGSAGAYNARGLPSNLPSRIQLGGTAYNFVQIEETDNAGTLTRLGCVGPFTAATSDQAPQNELLYLRYDEAPQDSPALFRYEAGTTFSVEFEITGNAQVVAAAEQRYRVAETWQQVAYSSVTVILYAPDGADLSSPRLYAKRVDASVIGEYVVESEAGEVSDALTQDAGTYEINTDLVVGGTRYVLVAVWTPSGTTTNGFVTLLSPRGVDAPERLLGVNPLRPGLLIYQT